MLAASAYRGPSPPALERRPRSGTIGSCKAEVHEPCKPRGRNRGTCGVLPRCTCGTPTCAPTHRGKQCICPAASSRLNTNTPCRRVLCIAGIGCCCQLPGRRRTGSCHQTTSGIHVSSMVRTSTLRIRRGRTITAEMTLTIRELSRNQTILRAQTGAVDDPGGEPNHLCAKNSVRIRLPTDWRVTATQQQVEVVDAYLLAL